jgi:hypothetical protein
VAAGRRGVLPDPWRRRVGRPYEVEQAFAIDGERLELPSPDEPRRRADARRVRHPSVVREAVAVAINGAAVHPDNLATEAEPVPVAGALIAIALEPMPEDLDATWTDIGSRRSRWRGRGRASPARSPSTRRRGS